MRNQHPAAALFLLILLLVAQPDMVQNFENGFPFYLPADDSSTQKFLPPFPVDPIATDEFVVVNSEGHFVVKDRRMRFLGVNLAADGAFPTKTKAGLIAGRMRKMGINLVRFHHMDNPWSRESLFEWGQDTRHLNPVTLNRFEYLISQLKQNGIYANINLHCSRTVKTADGIPDADSLPDFGKGANLFDPDLIALQKEYARQLLSHVNPYTGLALVDDPVMAMVEIVNENSLYRIWRDDGLKHFSSGGKLTRRHAQLLDDRWLDFLTAKYGTDEALNAAWNVGVDSAACVNQIPDGGFETLPLTGNWELELHNNANALMTRVADAYEGDQCARITILQPGTESWHLQWKQPALTVRQDSVYLVSFAARADAVREIELAILQNSSPWTWFGGQKFKVTTEWCEFQFTFRAPATCTDNTRLAFSFGLTGGSFWFDNIFFGKPAVVGLGDDETLENRNVRRIAYRECLRYTDARVRDISSFYIGLQDEFFNEMATFLKSELGVQVPITGTNWNVGVGDLVSQARLDYVDNHAYWDHPQFPNEPWSGTDWLINNTSMLTSKTGGTISALFGGVPVQGKPYTVSEYNHPFPNRFQTEGVLMAAAYAGFHDIDGLMLFDYNGNSSDDWETDFISSYFSIHRNTVMMALLPSCAKAFRTACIQPANEVITISCHADDILLAPKADDGSWTGHFPVARSLALQHAVKIESFQASQRISPVNYSPAFPVTTDTGELIWDNDLFTVNTPKFIGLTGWLHDYQNLTVGDLELVGAGNIATLTWISLQDRPLRTSKTSLMTLSTRIQNQGMLWDGIQTFHDNWGHAPTEIEPVIVSVKLNISADSLHVFGLDGTGKENGHPATILPDGDGRFSILLSQLQQPTVWFGIEAFGDQIEENAVEPPIIPEKCHLTRIYPNPFNSRTLIEISLPDSRQIELLIYDLNGRLVRAIKQHLTAGKHQIAWDGKNTGGLTVSSGIYFIQLISESAGDIKKCVFLR